MIYDFQKYQDNICELSIEELESFSINLKALINPGKNQSEKQILLRLFQMLQNEILSKEFQQNFNNQNIQMTNRLIHLYNFGSASFSQDSRYLIVSYYLEVSIIKILEIENNFQIFAQFSTSVHPIDSVLLSFDNQHILSFNSEYFQVWSSKQNNSLFEIAFNFQRKARINSITFSPNNKYIVAAYEDKNFKVWDAQKEYQLLKIIEAHNNEVKCAVFSNNSQYLATGSTDRTFSIWDSENDFQLIIQIATHHEILNIGFSFDCQYIVTSFADKTCQVWDMKNKFHLINTINSVLFMDISKRDLSLATANDDKTCKIINLSNQFVVKTIDLFSEQISCIQYSYSQNYLAIASIDKSLKILNILKDYEHLITINNNVSPIISISFSQDGKHLAACFSDNSFCQIFNVQCNFKLESRIQVKASVAIFSPDSKYLVTNSNNTDESSLNIWNLQNYFEEFDQKQKHTQQILSIAFSNDQKYFATSSSDRLCKIWDINNGFQFLHQIKDHTDEVNLIAFSKDSNYLITTSLDKTLKIWNTKDGFSLIKSINADIYYIQSMDLTNDYLVTVSTYELKIWDIKKQFELLNIKDLQIGQIKKIGFFQNEKYFYAIAQKFINIYDYKNEFKIIKKIQQYQDEGVQKVVISNDSKYLAWSESNHLQILEVEKVFQIKQNFQAFDEIKQICFFCDSNFILALSAKSSFDIYNIQKGEKLIQALNQLSISQNPPLSFTIDGKYLALGCYDATCKIFITDQGQQESNFQPESNL
ncbi:WD domain, G-beta repeat protein (macronuclear) [Tetrahymena thermophila SB210]|uniref:WD domain, G-beta repeat protein n=1 Tax=Tetrahymena thermophila (strain SB210) TaxID=312017 RepID=I7LUJ0_TETTS|nr:WD domain, G-beta repeat protein [Tetrahymena thermophila SB210]EAR93869.2 WD domain, G-beta repeat protein [Tetrahymena thermophila SB210]|eukprot:XP_001014114.2 WD domain, G-beta repeat protein [Tetrahymena thermophila SB210]